MVLEDGCIKEQGKFAELVALGGVFSQLAREQLQMKSDARTVPNLLGA